MYTLNAVVACVAPLRCKAVDSAAAVEVVTVASCD